MSLLLCYVGHHDEAYRWAERRKLESHPKTGAAQFVEIRETVKDVFVPKYAEVAEQIAPKPRLFDHVADEELLSYGVPAEWLADVRETNEESFFVRHAYFLGANDPYRSLKTTLKAEINEEAWATLNSDISRPFEKPKSGRIAVKVINHLGDEVMKVFRV